jgi:hypothetical protein
MVSSEPSQAGYTQLSNKYTQSMEHPSSRMSATADALLTLQIQHTVSSATQWQLEALQGASVRTTWCCKLHGVVHVPAVLLTTLNSLLKHNRLPMYCQAKPLDYIYFILLFLLDTAQPAETHVSCTWVQKLPASVKNAQHTLPLAFVSHSRVRTALH